MANVQKCMSTKRANPRRVAGRGILLRRENTLECKKWCDGEGDLGKTNLHMEIRVSVDKILHKVLLF